MAYVRCVNETCPEHGVDKDAGDFDLAETVILCGECGERCEAGE